MIQFRCHTSDPPLSPLAPISLTGKVISSEVPISNCRVDLIGEAESWKIYTDSTGNFDFQITPMVSYEISCYSLKLSEYRYSFSPRADTSLTIRLSPVDYYPTEVGSYWKYSYESSEMGLVKKNLIIEREIISKEQNIINEILNLKGLVTSLTDTTIIDQVVSFSDTIGTDGYLNTFLNYIPGKYIFSSYVNPYRRINKYLHTGIYAEISNPPSLIQAEYISTSKYPTARGHRTIKGGSNNKPYPYIIIANNVGIIEIFNSESMGSITISHKLVLLETNL